MNKIPLVIEKANNHFTGRILYDQNLIISESKDLMSLEVDLKKQLKKFHKINPESVQFDHKYDLTSLFEKFAFLKVSSIAEAADMNPSLLRQYVIGHKFASPNQAKKIEQTIRRIGKELIAVQIYSKHDQQ